MDIESVYRTIDNSTDEVSTNVSNSYKSIKLVYDKIAC